MTVHRRASGAGLADPFPRRAPRSYLKGVTMSQCEGFPPGHVCPVVIHGEEDYCIGCQTRYRVFLDQGLSVTRPVPVGVVLEDFAAPVPKCACGGNPVAPDHVHSLLHAKWAWIQGKAEPHEISIGRHEHDLEFSRLR